eukprot:212284-Chlamydomonas_euryale.AAC.4
MGQRRRGDGGGQAKSAALSVKEDVMNVQLRMGGVGAGRLSLWQGERAAIGRHRTPSGADARPPPAAVLLGSGERIGECRRGGRGKYVLTDRVRVRLSESSSEVA